MTAVQGQFGDDLVLDDGSDCCCLRLQQVRGSRNFDRVPDLTEFKNNVEPHHLLNLDIKCFGGCRLEAGKLRSQSV